MKKKYRNVKKKPFEYSILYSKFNQNFSPFIWNLSLILKKYMYVYILYIPRKVDVGEKNADAENIPFERKEEQYRKKQQKNYVKEQPKPHALNRMAKIF